MEKEKFTVKFAQTKEENDSAYSLRFTDMLKDYRPEIQRDNDMDITPYDEYARQIICIDNENKKVVGCYRIIISDDVPKGKTFVCEDEFDISSLRQTGERIAELSRAVVKREYRNTMVLMLLLRFIMQYIKEQNFRFIIGEASFLGTDKNLYVKELSYLAHFYSCKDYGVKSLEKEQVKILPETDFDVGDIKRNLPPLIRAYLGFGAKMSEDSFTDREFGSVDVFVLMDSKNYNDAYIKRLLKL